MGMSSSQARLLSLTSRQHDIEYKAQKLEAQKLQMANESTHVYQKYEDALNASKIQGATIGTDGSQKFIDADLLVLENNGTEKLAKSIYLRNTDNNKIYVSRTNATKYNLPDTGIPGTEIEFMNRAGFESQVLNFATISNTTPVSSYSAIKTSNSGVTTREVPNINPDWGYQAVSHDSTAGLETVSSVAAFNAGQTYAINSKEDLLALKTLTNSGVATQGVNFVLGNNIDLSGETWDGIGNTTANSFKGNLDGNGYSISNLTGTSGLFRYLVGNQTSVTDPTSGVTTTSSYGIIKDLSITNVNIKKIASNDQAGALADKADYATIENCKTTGSINGNHWVGGLIGYNISSAVSQSTSTVNIDASSCCDGGLIGHDTNGIISNCVSTGTVIGRGGNAGGLIGHETSSGKTFIYQCATTSTVSGGTPGAFIGTIDSGCAATVIESLYAATGTAAVGSGTNNMTSSGGGASLSSGATRTVSTSKITLPSQTSVASNIAMLVDKSGMTVGADFTTKLNTWLSQFYQEDPRYYDNTLVQSALKLASINDFIVKYLENSSNEGIATSLINDINNNSLTSTAAYQDNYKQTKDYEYTPLAAGTSNAIKTTTLTTGSTENVANNVYTALRNAGHTELSTTADAAKVQTWVNSKYSTTSEAGKLALAELNNFVTSGNADPTEREKLYTAINNNSTYTIPTASKAYVDPLTTYNVSISNQAQDYEKGWDMSDPDTVAALEYYQIIKDGYIVVEDEQASNKNWLQNLIDMGIAIFSEYDKTTNTTIDTNVATNTALQSATDETDIKKAEAEYEASMRKIDDKDKRYDIELAALDNERNAIKTEMDTLKSVAKDNVDRTFKLFG